MGRENDPSGTAGERQYREIMKPGLEYQRAKLDPLRNPVKVVLLDAFIALYEHAIYGDFSGDTARKEIEEINELKPWVNPSVESGWDEIVGGPLPKILRDEGYTHNDALQILGRARKRDAWRPVELIAIEALEMSLAGKSIREIADALCDLPPREHLHGSLTPRPHENNDECCDRFRHLIKNLRVIYEKHKPG